MPCAADRERLALLQARLRALDLRLPPAHERAIHEVARAALTEAIRTLGHRLAEGAYWRGAPVQMSEPLPFAAAPRARSA